MDNNNINYNVYHVYGRDEHSNIYDNAGPPQNFENTVLSMLGFIIFFSVFSTLCGICKSDDDRSSLFNDETINTQLIRIVQEKISNYQQNEKGDEFCSICLEEFKQNDKIITLECDHYYHKVCITDWFKKETSCPLCRETFI